MTKTFDSERFYSKITIMNNKRREKEMTKRQTYLSEGKIEEFETTIRENTRKVRRPIPKSVYAPNKTGQQLSLKIK